MRGCRCLCKERCRAHRRWWPLADMWKHVLSCQSFLCSQHPHWNSVLNIGLNREDRGRWCSPPVIPFPTLLAPAPSSSPHHPGLGLLDRRQKTAGYCRKACRLGPTEWPDQRSPLLGPAAGYPPPPFYSSPPPTTELKLNIRFIIFGERKSFTPFITGIKGNKAKEVNIHY